MIKINVIINIHLFLSNKFTVLYDKNKCILIIYFYYIAEKNIKKIKKEIEEIKMFYKN